MAKINKNGRKVLILQPCMHACLDFKFAKQSVNHYPCEELNKPQSYEYTFTIISYCSTTVYWKHQCLELSYEMDGSGTDVTGNAHNASIVGATTTNDHNGNADEAQYFDGTSDHLVINSNTPVINSSEFSIQFWARMDGTGGGIDGTNPVFSQRSDNTSQTQSGESIIGVYLENQSGNIQFSLRDDISPTGSGSVLTYPSMPYGSWHCYNFTLENDTMKLYIDGQLVQTEVSTQTGSFTAGIDYVAVGKHSYSGSPKGYFNGAISHLDIYNCVTGGIPMCAPSVDVEEIGMQSGLVVYPNPTKDIVRFNQSMFGKEFKVLDHLGRVIDKGTMTTDQISLGKFQPGVYMIMIDNMFVNRVILR